MSTIVVLDDLLPLPRTDAIAWTHVEIEQAADAGGQPGPWTSIETQALNPVDADPAYPALRTITVHGTLDPAWYHVRWLDADAGVSRFSDPVFTGDLVNSDLRPTVADVAALVRARTKERGSGGREIGTFTASTRPTADDVEALIDEALDEVLGKVADPDTDVDLKDPGGYRRRIRGGVRLYAAMLVELSYYPEQIGTDRSPFAALEKLYDSRMKALIAEGEVGRPGGEGDGDAPADAAWWFPDDAGGLVGWASRW